MAHALTDTDKMVSAGGILPWHFGETGQDGRAKVVEQELLTADEALKEAGLTWTVEEEPLFVGHGNDLTNRFKATTRSDIKGEDRILGIVGSDYTVVQPGETFKFLDELAGTDAAKYETAGSLMGGRRTFVTMRLPREILIGGAESEKIGLYLNAVNGNDGSFAFTLATSAVRMVCKNTVDAALASASRTWSARHTSGIHGRIVEAAEALDFSYNYAEAIESLGNDLLAKKVSAKAWTTFLSTLVPYSAADILAKDQGETGGRSAKNVDERREAIDVIYKPTDDLADIKGTGWGAYQAVTAWDSHHRETRDTERVSAGERKMLRNLKGSKLASRAVALLAPEHSNKKALALVS